MCRRSAHSPLGASFWQPWPVQTSPDWKTERSRVNQDNWTEWGGEMEGGMEGRDGGKGGRSEGWRMYEKSRGGA